MHADTADLIVIGYGAAGAAAAMEAVACGATVIVTEKQAETAHTPSTKMSGGIIMTATEEGAATKYLDACAGGMVPEVVSRAWAARATDLLSWLDRHGVEHGLTPCGGAERPELPGADSIVTVQPDAPERLSPTAGAGRAVWRFLSETVQQLEDVEVRWSSPARRLVRENGRVVGVEVDDAQGGSTTLWGRQGVVLSCGGFEFDEQLKQNHLRTYPVHFYGNPGNTGDGVRMAQQVGADLWHMNQMVGRGIGLFRLDDGTEQGFMIGIDPPGYVITDRDGHRFANEEPQARLLHGFYYDLIAFDAEGGEYPRNPSYWFFDERRRTAGPLTYTHIGACGVGMYEWSEDNSEEIRRGWIHHGDSLEEGARAAGVRDPGAAAEAVEAYNRSCEQGRDEFGRDPATLVPLDQPPYYCVPLWPGGSNTTGGPRRDEHARVLDAFMEPIPGLYAAGELGQWSGMLYPADGSNLSEALCSGRAAAQHATSEVI